MLNSKDRFLFNEFFQSNDRRDILKKFGESSENIRIDVKYYKAIELIQLYIRFALIPKKDINGKINSFDNRENSSFEFYLASSVFDNYDKISRYKDMVEMANTLG